MSGGTVEILFREIKLIWQRWRKEMLWLRIGGEGGRKGGDVETPILNNGENVWVMSE